MRPSHSLTLLAMACLLSACASHRGGTPDDAPTIQSILNRPVTIDKDQPLPVTEAQAIEAYQQFLAVAPQAAQGAEAMRRIADLEMDRADAEAANAIASSTGVPDYRAAIARYQEQLAAHPQAPHRDRVLYQLARAQEQGGELEAALKTLDQLVQQHPDTGFRDEAQFRIGEMRFAARDHAGAERAYGVVLASGPASPYHDRALYMQGWSRFKQGRLDDALQSFMGVLDVKLSGLDSEAGLDTVQGLSRADRELVEDTFRVISLSLSSLQGAEGIAALSDTTPQRRAYAFHVYEQLAELYLKQDRPKDAADALQRFAQRQPLDPQAPRLEARVIDIDERAGFAALALAAKKAFVQRYALGSDFSRERPQAWALAQPVVKTHLAELARHHHALAQKSHRSADYQEAVHWYRTYLAAFPADPQAAQSNFLLAELLFEDARFAEASVEYEKAAYAYPPHAHSADAGYAALLSYAQQLKPAAMTSANASANPSSANGPAHTLATKSSKRTPRKPISGPAAPQAAEPTPPAPPAPMPPALDVQAAQALQLTSVASARRFAQAFPADARTGLVLSNAADQLYALQDAEQAQGVAQQVLDLEPAAAPVQRRVAWTVLAHTAFEQGAFDRAEKAYGEVLALTPAQAAGRKDLLERQAAAVYKQGEQARTAGDLVAAVGHFGRVAAVAPQSPVQAVAQFDAAAAWIALKNWPAAARTLEDFRQRHPGHPLQAEVGPKLALAYIEQGQWPSAAAEMERLSASSKDPAVAREALWQAAEFHEKAGAKPAATKAYERHLAQSLAMRPVPLEPAIEARARLARIAHAEGKLPRELALMKDIYQADQAGGSARTERTRFLGATAALALAEPVAEGYRKVALVEPLQKQLKLKKAKMTEALNAYALAADYGVAEVSTAATFQTASIYREFGRALMNSERPKKMSAVEREQYDVLIEEQAFPFEEKATALHELNAQRVAQGLYDPWVQRSFEALRELLPVRYGKAERGEGVAVAKVAPASSAAPGTSVTPAVAPTPEAIARLEQAAQAEPRQAAALNQLGVAYRQLGRFDDARKAYEQAVAANEAYAPAVLNLGILQDLYLGDAAHAQAQYERYLVLTPSGDATVSKWLAEIKKRKPSAPKEAS
jgi:tetratricopeptide (TPR) repeat protein